MREKLIEAKGIFDKLGWVVKENILHDDEGKKVEFRFLLAQKGFERILAPFAENLKKLLKFLSKFLLEYFSISVFRLKLHHISNNLDQYHDFVCPTKLFHG